MLLAPWTEDQVASLNAYQEESESSPFVCMNGGHILVAAEDGWFCEICKGFCNINVTQNWCHDWMADWSWKHRPAENIKWLKSS